MSLIYSKDRVLFLSSSETTTTLKKRIFLSLLGFHVSAEKTKNVFSKLLQVLNQSYIRFQKDLLTESQKNEIGAYISQINAFENFRKRKSNLNIAYKYLIVDSLFESEIFSAPEVIKIFSVLRSITVDLNEEQNILNSRLHPYDGLIDSMFLDNLSVYPKLSLENIFAISLKNMVHLLSETEKSDLSLKLINAIKVVCLDNNETERRINELFLFINSQIAS